MNWLMVGIEFLAVIKRCQMKYLWGCLLSLVRLGRMHVLSNVQYVVLTWVDEKDFHEFVRKLVLILSSPMRCLG